MTYQPHDFSNLSLAGKYLNTLTTDDISRRYFSGEKYVSGLASRLKFFLFTDSVLSELNKFYPYQPLVKRTYQLYQQKLESNRKIAYGVSGFGIFAIYQLARQNVVLPLFSKYGKFLKTHRLLRQYLWVALLPFIIATDYTNYYFLNQTEKLWIVHAQRLNNKILSDPNGSQYPRELLPVSQVGVWQQPWIHRYDLSKKWANQTHIALAPDYIDVEEWERVQVVDTDAQGEPAASEESAGQSEE